MEEGPPAAKRQRMDLPPVGFGTYKLGAETEACVLAALGCGYRLIDTAQIYGNEKAVGQAITKSGLPRQEIFVTSKVWRTKHGYERARASCLQTLKDLGLQYIDLMLVHWPRRGFEGSCVFRASPTSAATFVKLYANPFAGLDRRRGGPSSAAQQAQPTGRRQCATIRGEPLRILWTRAC